MLLSCDQVVKMPNITSAVYQWHNNQEDCPCKALKSVRKFTEDIIAQQQTNRRDLRRRSDTVILNANDILLRERRSPFQKSRTRRSNKKATPPYDNELKPVVMRILQQGIDDGASSTDYEAPGPSNEDIIEDETVPMTDNELNPAMGMNNSASCFDDEVLASSTQEHIEDQASTVDDNVLKPVVMRVVAQMMSDNPRFVDGPSTQENIEDQATPVDDDVLKPAVMHIVEQMMGDSALCFVDETPGPSTQEKAAVVDDNELVLPSTPENLPDSIENSDNGNEIQPSTSTVPEESDTVLINESTSPHRDDPANVGATTSFDVLDFIKEVHLDNSARKRCVVRDGVKYIDGEAFYSLRSPVFEEIPLSSEIRTRKKRKSGWRKFLAVIAELFLCFTPPDFAFDGYIPPHGKGSLEKAKEVTCKREL